MDFVQDAVADVICGLTPWMILLGLCAFPLSVSIWATEKDTQEPFTTILWWALIGSLAVVLVGALLHKRIECL